MRLNAFGLPCSLIFGDDLLDRGIGLCHSIDEDRRNFPVQNAKRAVKASAAFGVGAIANRVMQNQVNALTWRLS
jgi:hypothetical protein